MQKAKIEPGLVNVFRWYVVLRFVFSISMPLVSTQIGKRGEWGREIDTTALFIATAVEMLLLFGYLVWPWLRKKMGKFFLPVGLILATIGLLLEQHFFSGSARFGQPFPFLYVLLILVAWQYRFREVLIFILGAALLEIALLQVFPQTSDFIFRDPETYQMVTYGRIVASSFSYLLLGYIVTSLMKAQRKQRQKLTNANLKLVQHAATVEQLSISRERVRLSREMHDTLAHTLSALAVQFDALATVWESIPDKARQMIEQMQATTRSGLDETRRALRDLRASPLEEFGLVLSLQGLAEDFAARQNLSLELELAESVDDLPHEVEQCYYRVAQESLENIARHAAADSLKIQMMNDILGLAMTISDNGRGFDVSDDVTKEHLGLQGMRERAGLIGADLEVDSSPGEGTTVRLYLENGA
ncbi:MAG: sensor histidine kinase [Anaerolineales bacterium]|nr:sensor histidine kinase [Chloroflexota bacterium]MBL6982614.1 sensor histidine kinase [Anaerolineales bacterium]